MTRLWWLALLVTSGCVRIDTTTRVERGPLLSTFERPVVVEGDVAAELRAEWPLLKLTITTHDVCRSEQVEVYAEEHITEKTSGALGPTVSTGIANVLASGVLLVASFLVTSTADTNIIDRGGRYGPSTQQYLQGASLITLGVGVPSLVVALISRLGTGDETVVKRTEQVVGQQDTRCNERPVEGPLTLGRSAQTWAVVDGAADLDATAVRGVPETLRFADRELRLTDDAQAVFGAWTACVTLTQSPSTDLVAMGDLTLTNRAASLRECRRIRGDDLADALKDVDAEILRRRQAGSPVTWSPDAVVSSFEEAIATYAPKARLSATSTELGLLDAPEAHQGQAVVVQGIVGEGLTENIGVIQVGDRQVFLFIPPGKTWRGTFANGTRIEAVALIAGQQTLGERTLPLLRAVWMRAAY